MIRSLAGVVAGGAALALAFPAPDLHLLAWVALVPLFVAVRGASVQGAWWLGVAFGIAFRVGTQHWVVDAMTRFGGLPVPAALAGAAALFGYLAIYPGLFALAIRRLDPGRATFPLLAAAIWTGLELLQARLFTGFPWLLLGYAGGRSTLMIQAADLAGVFGLSFLVVAFNAALAGVALRGRSGWRPATAPVALIAACALYGGVRLGPLQPAETGDTLRVGLVQGNVPQDEKWDRDAMGAVLGRHLELTAEAAADGADLVVWPESAWPDPWGYERSGAAELLRGTARRAGTSVLVGTVRVDERPEGLEVANAAVLVDADGQDVGGYEKVQLVPFGEYLPFRRYLGFLGPLVQAVGELRAGAQAQPLVAAPSRGVPPLGVSICYEIIFPWIARDHVRRGAGLLVTITNDAWYGRSSAPWQHFAMARMRAVETRRWLLRAANTGISGIVDPAGRVTVSSGLFEPAALSGTVAARAGLTPYARFGDAFAWACLLVGAAGVALTGRARALDVRSTVRSDP